MKIAKNNLCDAIQLKENEQEFINNTKQKEYKSVLVRETKERQLQLAEENINIVNDAIANYIIEYPEEKCSMTCKNCPLSNSL